MFTIRVYVLSYFIECLYFSKITKTLNSIFDYLCDFLLTTEGVLQANSHQVERKVVEDWGRQIEGRQNRSNSNYKGKKFSFSSFQAQAYFQGSFRIAKFSQELLIRWWMSRGLKVVFFPRKTATKILLWFLVSVTFIGKNLSHEYPSSFPKWKWNVSIRSK